MTAAAATTTAAGAAANPAPTFLQSVYAATAARSEAEREARQLCALLTDDERSALMLTARGLLRRDVAQRLGRGVGTVENWVCRGLNTLGVDTPIEAAVTLTKAGLL